MPHHPIAHTADIGFQVSAQTLEGLFAEAAAAFTDCLVEKRGALAVQERRTVRLEAQSFEELLVAWLEELLFLFETKGLIGVEFKVARCELKNFEAEVEGVEWDEKKQPLKTQIKAVTYHGLKIEKKPSGFTAQIILDV